MQLQTMIPLSSKAFMELDSAASFWGSCFSQVIEEKLANVGLNTQPSPFGILYNPIAISQSMDDLLEQKISEKHIVQTPDEVYASYDFHGQQSSSKADIKSMLENECNSYRSWFQNAEVLVVTFGTAWVYQLKSNQRIVNNCQKMNPKLFDRRLL